MLKDLVLVEWVAWVLVLIGAINWGLVGLLGLNLVEVIFGSLLSRLIFILVGVAGGYIIYLKVKKRTTLS